MSNFARQAGRQVASHSQSIVMESVSERARHGKLATSVKKVNPQS